MTTKEPGVALLSLIGVQGILELAGGFLILIGLFTRPVAFILAGDMAVAYFMAHAPKDFFPTVNGGQLAILFCFVFLYLVFAGAGPWSAAPSRRHRSSAESISENAMPLTRLRDPYILQDGVRFLMADESGNRVACQVSHEALRDHAARVHLSGPDSAVFEAYRELIEDVAKRNLRY
jgi:hypothetical protein